MQQGCGLSPLNSSRMISASKLASQGKWDNSGRSHRGQDVRLRMSGKQQTESRQGLSVRVV
jgi:hypothetical protein